MDRGRVLVAGLALKVLLSSCAGPTLAQRDYSSNPRDRRGEAYSDVENILADICCSLPSDSYPDCKYLQLNQTGFRCEQLVPPHGEIVSDYRWDEIESVECQGRTVLVRGAYNFSDLYTKGPVWQETTQQCLDLAEAMTIYLEGRKGK